MQTNFRETANLKGWGRRRLSIQVGL